MTVRWRTAVRPRGDTWTVDLVRVEGERWQSIRVSVHASRAEAEVARGAVRLDPAAHWREPRKRGRKAQEVRWSVELRQSPHTGAWIVSLSRVPRAGRKRSRALQHCATREDAEALRRTVRADPSAHWVEPKSEPTRQLESKRRAAQERVERARQALAEASLPGVPVRLEDGWWELPCGLHESRRLHLHCATCERAAAELAERLEGVARGAAVAEARRTHKSDAAQSVAIVARNHHDYECL